MNDPSVRQCPSTVQRVSWSPWYHQLAVQGRAQNRHSVWGCGGKGVVPKAQEGEPQGSLWWGLFQGINPPTTGRLSAPQRVKLLLPSLIPKLAKSQTLGLPEQREET